SSFLFGPLWGTNAMMLALPSESLRPGPYERALRPYRDRMVAQVPREGGVVAAFEFLARFANRGEVHALHHVMGGLYTFSERPYPVPTGISALIADMSEERERSYMIPGSGERMQSLLRLNRLRPAAAAGDQVLFLRN